MLYFLIEPVFRGTDATRAQWASDDDIADIITSVDQITMMNYIKRFYVGRGELYFSVLRPGRVNNLFALIQAHFFPAVLSGQLGFFLHCGHDCFGCYVKW